MVGCASAQDKDPKENLVVEENMFDVKWVNIEDYNNWIEYIDDRIKEIESVKKD